MQHPEVSIITVNYNGSECLRKCFNSIVSQDYPRNRMRMIVVDNASSDGSVDFIKRSYEGVEVIESGGNVGYSGGGNVGYSHATGKYVIFMANDMFFPENWVTEMVRFMEDHPEAAIGTTLLVGGESVEGYVGEIVNASPVLAGKGDAVGDGYTAVPWGGACIIRKELFDLPFDSEYFIYGEDIYLGLRSWLKGFRVMANKIKVAHLGTVTMGFFSRTQVHYNERNRLTNLLLFFKKRTLLMLSPLVIADLLIRFFYFAGIGRADLLDAEASAVWWNIRNLRKNLRKRVAMQAERKVKDNVILDVLCEQVYGKGKVKVAVNFVMTGYFRIVKAVCRWLGA